MFDPSVFHASGLQIGMPVLPEDKNLVVLAGDGYVAGTAFALIALQEPRLTAEMESGRWWKHDFAQSKAALKIKLIATVFGLLLTVLWLLGSCGVFGSEYHFLPDDHSLFAAIPLFGLADMLAGAYAFFKVRPPKRVDKEQAAKLIERRELGDTTSQLFSTCVASVYLGFWLCSFLSSRW